MVWSASLFQNTIYLPNAYIERSSIYVTWSCSQLEIQTDSEGIQWLQMLQININLGGDLPNCLAADWFQTARNEFKSSERNRKVYCSAEKGKHVQVGCWPVAAKRVGLLISPQKKVKTERKSVSSAHKLDGLGKLKEHAPRSEHVHLHQDIGHIRKNHLHATLLPQLSKYAHASGIY